MPFSSIYQMVLLSKAAIYLYKANVLEMLFEQTCKGWYETSAGSINISTELTLLVVA